MANDLSAIMPKILARGLLTLREQAVMPRLVNLDYGSDAAEKGDTIDVPIPTAKTAQDVTPSEVPPATADSTPGKVQIALDNWKHVDFKLSDRDLMEVDRERHFLPLEMAEAVRALANEVNLSLHQQYKGIYGFVGTAATTPFGSDATEAIAARKALLTQAAPKTDRRIVLDFDAETNALALPDFADVEKTGESGVKVEGETGRKYGFDWFSDDTVQTHTAGTLTGTIAVSGAHALGATSIILATDGGEAVNLLEGDVVTFAGDTQTYVVGADVNIGASTTGGITIYPGLKVALAGGEQISVKGDHVVNLAFHRDAFAFANRPLAQGTAEMALGNGIVSMTDPQTGISMRLEVSRQHKQTVWDLDILWGAKLVRPELACRIAG
ncbi:MAG: P22 phage major capsid protein family protein [Magnetospiraceae bacterium]